MDFVAPNVGPRIKHNCGTENFDFLTRHSRNQKFTVIDVGSAQPHGRQHAFRSRVVKELPSLDSSVTTLALQALGHHEVGLSVPFLRGMGIGHLILASCAKAVV